MREFTEHDFTGHIDAIFLTTDNSGQDVELKLIRVERSGTVPERSDQRQPFSLLFQGPTDGVLPQEIRTLRHPAFEDLVVFAVPVLGPGGLPEYEVIFN